MKEILLTEKEMVFLVLLYFHDLLKRNQNKVNDVILVSLCLTLNTFHIMP